MKCVSVTAGTDGFFVAYIVDDSVVQKGFANPFEALTFGGELADFFDVEFLVDKGLFYGWEG